jgi:hypothetical protein
MNGMRKLIINRNLKKSAETLGDKIRNENGTMLAKEIIYKESDYALKVIRE